MRRLRSLLRQVLLTMCNLVQRGATCRGTIKFRFRGSGIALPQNLSPSAEPLEDAYETDPFRPLLS